MVLLRFRLNLKQHSITLVRRVIQITTFFLINYVILETIFGINLNAFEGLVKVLPILNSPRNPLSTGAGILEYIFYSIGQGFFPIMLIGIFMLVILFTNRSFCGWVCPIGTIQDACAAIPVKKRALKTSTHKLFLNVRIHFLLFHSIYD